MLTFWSKNMMMCKTSVYDKGQVLFESSTPGTYSLNVEETAECEVYCIGAGGGGAAGVYKRGGFGSRYYYAAAGGGSGGGFIGTVKINEGSYPLVVGKGGPGAGGGEGRHDAGDGGSSSIGNGIVCGGGIGGYARADITHYGTPGTGGTAPVITFEVLQTQKNSAGNAGGGSTSSSVTGGAAIYENYGTGGDGTLNGTSGTGTDGANGYIKIVYKGK